MNSFYFTLLLALIASQFKFESKSTIIESPLKKTEKIQRSEDSSFVSFITFSYTETVLQLNYNHLKLDNFSSFSSDLVPQDRRRRSLVLEGKESTKFNTTQFQGSSHTRAHCL
ncbi:hypothetical protein ACET3Z_011367 [Daucus carota]